MKSPASSFRAEETSHRWYREPWPWLLMAGPLAVVVASLASAWLAFRSDDGVVASDYYKRGLEINRKGPLPTVDPMGELGATITVTAQGEARVLLEGVVDTPKELRLELARPGAAMSIETVTLRAGRAGEYVGAITDRGPGRRIVTLQSSAWRLPTTVTSQLSEIRLGATERHASSGAGATEHP
jgi:hypothetical protein